MADMEYPPFPGDWERKLPANTGAWTVGPVWIDLAQGKYCMRVAPQHCNAFGMMHGGALATFADTQIVAVRSYSGEEAGYTPTITLSVDYFASVPEGSWLVLCGEVLRTTRTMTFTQALITVGDEIVARSNAIYRNIKDKGA